MRFDYECDVVCKIVVLVEEDPYEPKYRTFTGRTLDGVKAGVAARFPYATLTFGEPVWVQR